jgi:hypothetical protein
VIKNCLYVARLNIFKVCSKEKAFGKQITFENVYLLEAVFAGSCVCWKLCLLEAVFAESCVCWKLCRVKEKEYRALCGKTESHLGLVTWDMCKQD